MVPYILDESPEMPVSVKRPAVMVVPGGGYSMTSDREAEPIALAFSCEGFQTFVLRYSVGPYASWPNPQVDLMRAMKTVRDNAEKWHVDKDAIAVCGFSAGGHLTASLGVFWNDQELQKAAGATCEDVKPNALILCYPVIDSGKHGHQGSINILWKGHEDEPELRERFALQNQVGPHTPPSFIVHTYYDNCVPVENSLLFAEALAKYDIPFELHITQNGVHGLALGNELTSSNNPYMVNKKFSGWPEKSADWLRELFGYNFPDEPKHPSARGLKRNF